MKLTLTYPNIANAGSGAASAFVLCDDSMRLISGSTVPAGWVKGAGGLQKEGFNLKQEREVQKTSLFRAAYKFKSARFNMDNLWTITVQRGFQSDEMASAFIALHADQVPASGELTVTFTLAASRQIYYNPNSIVKSIGHVKHQDMSVDTQYALELGGAWQTTA